MYDTIPTILSKSNYNCDHTCVAFNLKDTLALQEAEVSFFNSKMNKKIDLKNEMTFIIPIRIDNEIRFRNLNKIISFLEINYQNFKIIISEQDEKPKLNDKFNYEYLFEVSIKNFQKTKAINKAILKTDTTFACIYDSDYVVSPLSFNHCFKKLQTDAKFAHPSMGLNLYLDRQTSEKFIISNVLPSYKTLSDQAFFDPAHYLGLCFMFNVKSYKDIGMENQNFTTWGFEDQERFVRISKLNLKTYFSPSCGYHLWHPRNGDFYEGVTFKTDQIIHSYSNQNNLNELLKINSMSKNELLMELQNWEWYCPN